MMTHAPSRAPKLCALVVSVAMFAGCGADEMDPPTGPGTSAANTVDDGDETTAEPPAPVGAGMLYGPCTQIPTEQDPDLCGEGLTCVVVLDPELGRGGICLPSCDPDAEEPGCPAPTDGTANPVCTEADEGEFFCGLSCVVSTAVCPDDSACNTFFCGYF